MWEKRVNLKFQYWKMLNLSKIIIKKFENGKLFTNFKKNILEYNFFRKTVYKIKKIWYS